MRFNPPPNWPPVPPGWTPEPSWRPDPSWPPAPTGWQFWVDDAAAAPGPYPPAYPPANPPGYPPAGLPGYPSAYPSGYPPFPTPGSAKSRNGLWLGLAGIAAVAVLIAGSIWYFSGTGHGASGGGNASKKHDITTLTKDLLLDRSQFSGFDGDEWESDVDRTGRISDTSGSGGEITTSPTECADIQVGAPKGRSSSSQIAGSLLSGHDSSGMHTTMATLEIVAKEVDLADFLRRCRQYTSSISVDGESLTTTTTVRALDLSRLPKWAVAYSMETSSPAMPDAFAFSESSIVRVEGYYRGVLVGVGHFSMGRNGMGTFESSDKLVTLFNAQVAKLEAAP